MRHTIQLLLTLSIILGACSNKTDTDSSSNAKVTDTESNALPTDTNVDLCRCLTEPGNSAFMQEHGEACDALISKEIGVADWKKVNMSQNKEVSDRFDVLARRCSGEESTSIEPQKEDASVDGIYEGSQNVSGLVLESKLVIRGSRWSATSQLGYEGPEIQNGVVHGTDLYDDSGMLKIGYVSGDIARIDGYPSMRKK